VQRAIMNVSNVERDATQPTLSEWLAADPCWERVIMVVTIGAGLGAACASLVGVLIVLPQSPKYALLNGMGVGMLPGTPLGAVLAPLMWPLLRKVAIHRVVWGCCAGTVAGSLLGFGLTLPLYHIRSLDGIVGLGLLGGAVAGLVIASVRLSCTARKRADSSSRR
jgi:hypothetical protein